MRLQHIDAALTLCRKHRSSVEDAGIDSFQVKEIEHYLLRSMVMLIVSHFEDVVEKLFVKRAELCDDAEIHSLVSALTARRFRSPDLGKIKEMLKMLNPRYREAFHDFVEIKQPQTKAAWDSLMTARHAIVHKENQGSVTLTWTDLLVAYEESKRVLQALGRALDLKKKDIAQI